MHGFCSTAQDNWIRPHDPAAHTRDVLADDGFALIEALWLTDYDLARIIHDGDGLRISQAGLAA